MFVIGLDIGTTSTKAVVFDTKGKVRGEHGVEYPISTPHPGWAEQSPRAILDAAVQSIKEAVRKSGQTDFIGLGISAAMHSLILMDKDHQTLTETIIWTDTRSTDQTNRLLEGPGQAIYLRTGTPIHPMSPLSKILWFKQNRPDLFTRTAKFISIKEYLLYQWFGQYLTDYSIASATGMFNLDQTDWDSEVLELLQIEKQQLPAAVPTTYKLKGIRPEWAQKMGIDEKLPFIIGGSDGCLANLGIGALEKGDAAITIGTSGAIRTVVPHPLTDRQMRTFCYALTRDHWVIGGATNNGGLLLRWLSDQFAAGLTYKQLTEEASLAPPGSEGLICLPYLSGERAPIWNANARGIFFGVSLHHERKHFIRAVLEGVIFSIYGIGKALRDLSGDFHTLRASGGFIQSPLWCQILADVFGAEVIIPESHQSSSWGAAILVLYALGEIDRVDVFKDSLGERRRFVPHPQHHQTYQQLFSIYEEVYTSLIHPFDKIASFQRTK